MSTPPKKRNLDDPYHFGDTIPAPEALEKDTDTAWALFHELTEKHDAKFSPTVPGSMSAPLPGTSSGYAPTAPGGLTPARAQRRAPAPAEPLGLEELMVEARRNNRVCPRLEDWQALYDMLPDKRQVDGKWEPPLPISPQAWRVTSAMIKRLCLRDHLEWAAHHGAGMQVLVFLRALPEDKWLHME